MAELVSPQPPCLAFSNNPLPHSAASPNDKDSTAHNPDVLAFPADSASNTNQSLDFKCCSNQSISASNSNFHKRSRTSINKLPAFSFNPGACRGSSAEDEGTQSGPALAPPDSPSKGRHRRSTSELVGGNGGLKSSNLSPVKVDYIAPVDGVLHAFSGQPSQPTQRVHRRRQSEAPSSHDIPQQQLSATQDQASAGKDNECLFGVVERRTQPVTLADGELHMQVAASTAHAPVNPLDLQTNFGLSESVGDASRSLSENSDESGSSLSTLKDSTKSESKQLDMNHALLGALETARHKTSSKEQWNAADGPPFRKDQSDDPVDIHTAFHSHKADYHGTADFDLARLDENFDEDPTSTIVVDDVLQPNESLTDRLAISSFIPPPVADTNETGIIDLDMALASSTMPGSESPTHDYRSLHNRSFQTARRSMHSNAVMSGFMGPGMHYHRRTESAPLLATINFDRHFDGSASEKGFEMENVFEEDEEDAARGSGEHRGPRDERCQDEQSGGLGIGTRKEGVLGPRVNAGDDTVADGKSVWNQPHRQNEQCDEEYALTPPQAPFMRPGTPSNSSFSSQKYQGSSEHSVKFDQSADDVPSLVSGASTVASAVPSHCVTGSPQSPAPRSSASMSTLAKAEQRRRKRASVVSLSRLIGGPYPEERHLSSEERGKRFQSSDGLAPTKRSRSQRLSKLFKFWKSKGS